jgi:RNA polymerase sigma factor (TIGR02999 family)
MYSEIDLTKMLNGMESGDAFLSQELLETLYAELRKMAAAKMSRIPPGQTLQATALVHEAWMRLQKSGSNQWDNRRHFFAAAAEAMRRILIEQIRRKQRQRHGGELQRVDMEDVEISAEVKEDRVLLIHEALELLTKEDPVKAEIVKLKYFAGLKTEEISEVLDLSEKTVRRHWNVAKARLFQIIQQTR